MCIYICTCKTFAFEIASFHLIVGMQAPYIYFLCVCVFLFLLCNYVFVSIRVCFFLILRVY